ncbi:hypothetical protein FHT26_001182 [Rhizobacter sp. SG703]|nr:hypothetical protein [Rhizobacter sp. SG703]
MQSPRLFRLIAWKALGATEQGTVASAHIYGPMASYEPPPLCNKGFSGGYDCAGCYICIADRNFVCWTNKTGHYAWDTRCIDEIESLIGRTG